MLRWLREHNLEAEPAERVRFVGLDMQGLDRPSAALVSGTPAATQASDTASRVAKLSQPSSTTSAPATIRAAFSCPIRSDTARTSSAGSNRPAHSAATSALRRPMSPSANTVWRCKFDASITSSSTSVSRPIPAAAPVTRTVRPMSPVSIIKTP